ncbi:MAG: sulfatase-like hydrolase/transferase [Anaerolineae bacterium]|nr:sulfatase-like hydrolase/transferase [Anaerolineae bacterium]
MPQHPNILWLMTDEQRSDSLGYTGSPWAHTPHLDQLALSGTRFTSAYTPSPVCISARAGLLTGRYCSSIGILNNHHWLNLDDPQFLTWTFAAHGYQVASFGKHHYGHPRHAFDLEGGRILGNLVNYYEYKAPVDMAAADAVGYEGGEFPWLLAGKFPGTVNETPEMQNVNQALAWIKRRDPSRPYFLRLSLNAPHTPVVTPAPFDTLINSDAIQLPLDHPDAIEMVSDTHRDFLIQYGGAQRLSEAQIRRARQCYYGYVTCTDHILGKLLDQLREMGELNHTLIVYVADHGTHLGDHGFFQKQSYWEAAARVPLFFAGQGVQAEEIAAPVSSGSLLPTLLDMVGIEIPSQVQFPSLAETLRTGCPPQAAPVFGEIDYGAGNYRNGERYVMVRDGPWKLSLYRNPPGLARAGAREDRAREDRVLFNLETAPQEDHNLAHDPAHASVIETLVARIDAWDNARPIIEPGLVKRETGRR